MRAAKNLCPKPKKPVAMKSGGSAKGRNKPRSPSSNIIEKRTAKSTLKKAKKDLVGSGILYPLTKSSIRRAILKGEDKTDPQGFARMVKEAEKTEKALRDKKSSEETLKKFSGSKSVSRGRNKPVEKKSGGEAKKKVKKVVKALKKASKSHAGQAKTLQALSLKKGGKAKSRVNEAGNYTKPALRKRIFNRIKAGGKGGAPGQWSARKAQMTAAAYKKAGGGYRN